MLVQDEVDEIARDLARRLKQDMPGGKLIPFLLGLNSKVLQHLNYKVCYWILFGFALIFFGWRVSLLVIISGAFAIGASYKRPAPPSCVPDASINLDVLMGRSTVVSAEDPELHANNNVTITAFGGYYVVAYRQSDVHFPSSKTRLVVASSPDLRNWTRRWLHSNGTDLREMLFFEMNEQLILYYFSLVPRGDNFLPLHVFSTSSVDLSSWTDPREVCRNGEVPWEIKVRRENGKEVAYKASYLGDHYGAGDVLVLFERSHDGRLWEPAGESCTSVVYRGGICEVAFEFTASGDLVACGRNEDGDKTGFGTQLFYASKSDLGDWIALSVSIPYRFDSPRMCRSATGEILLFARWAPDTYHFAPAWLPFRAQTAVNLINYSLRSKGAAVYRILPREQWHDDGSNGIQFLRLLEAAFSDTGFFSMVRELGSEVTDDRWVLANYASTEFHSHAPWFIGQMQRTQITVCRFRILAPARTSVLLNSPTSFVDQTSFVEHRH